MKEFEIRSTHLQAENQKLVGYVVEWNSRSEPLFDFVMVSFPATAQRPVIVTQKEMIMKKLFTPEFKQKCLNLLLNERHTTIEVSKMMNCQRVCLTALESPISQRKTRYYSKTTRHYSRAAGNPTLTCRSGAT